MTNQTEKLEDNITLAIKEGKLYEGQIIKNYKEFCKLVNAEFTTNNNSNKKQPMGGNSKKAQIKKWQQYMKINKIPHSQSYLIEKIYNHPKHKDSQFLLERTLNELDMGEIYKIQIDNYRNCGYTLVYIGSTVKFRRRFNDHKNVNYNFPTGKLPNGEKLPSSSELLNEGGKFSIIEIFGNFSSMSSEEKKQKIKLLRKRENEIIKQYNEKENIILINRVINNKHIFSKGKKIKFQKQKITKKAKTSIVLNRKYNKQNYKFTLEKSTKEVIQEISKRIENSNLYEIINKAPKDKTAITIPYKITIGENDIQEYIGEIEITFCI